MTPEDARVLQVTDVATMPLLPEFPECLRWLRRASDLGSEAARGLLNDYGDWVEPHRGGSEGPWADAFLKTALECDLRTRAVEAQSGGVG